MTPFTWNATRLPAAPGENTLAFSVGWENYLDSNNDWLKLDGNLKDMGAFFGADALPFSVRIPKFSDEVATFVSNNRYDIFKKENISEPDFEQEIQALNVSRVAGHLEVVDVGWGPMESVVFPDAYPLLKADLIYYVHPGRAPRLKKVIRFREPISPTSDVEIPFKLSSGGRPDVTIGGNRVNTTKVRTKKGITQRVRGERGAGIKPLTMWNSGNGEARTKRTIAIDAEVHTRGSDLFITKIHPKAFFADSLYPLYSDTTSTFNPDAHVESTSVDGAVTKNNSTDWDTTHDATTGQAVLTTQTDVDLRAGSPPGQTNYLLARCFFLFDTSSIGGPITISASTVKLWGLFINNDDNDGDDFHTIIVSTPATDTDLITADYDQVGATDNPTKVSDDLDISSLSTGQYNTFTLNATGFAEIDSDEISRFGVREGHDQIDSPVDGNLNGMGVASADNATASQHPELSVTFTADSTFIPKLIVY